VPGADVPGADVPGAEAKVLAIDPYSARDEP